MFEFYFLKDTVNTILIGESEYNDSTLFCPIMSLDFDTYWYIRDIGKSILKSYPCGFYIVDGDFNIKTITSTPVTKIFGYDDDIIMQVINGKSLDETSGLYESTISYTACIIEDKLYFAANFSELYYKTKRLKTEDINKWEAELQNKPLTYDVLVECKSRGMSNNDISDIMGIDIEKINMNCRMFGFGTYWKRINTSGHTNGYYLSHIGPDESAIYNVSKLLIIDNNINIESVVSLINQYAKGTILILSNNCNSITNPHYSHKIYYEPATESIVKSIIALENPTILQQFNPMDVFNKSIGAKKAISMTNRLYFKSYYNLSDENTMGDIINVLIIGDKYEYIILDQFIPIDLTPIVQKMTIRGLAIISFIYANSEYYLHDVTSVIVDKIDIDHIHKSFKILFMDKKIKDL